MTEYLFDMRNYGKLADCVGTVNEAGFYLETVRSVDVQFGDFYQMIEVEIRYTGHVEGCRTIEWQHILKPNAQVIDELAACKTQETDYEEQLGEAYTLIETYESKLRSIAELASRKGD